MLGGGRRSLKKENNLTFCFVALKVKITNWRLVDRWPTLGRIFRQPLRPKNLPFKKNSDSDTTPYTFFVD
jgi:hypothetical protein